MSREAVRVTTRRALPAILFVLLVVGIYADPLFFRRNFGGRDLVGYNLPVEFAIHDAYARGRLPVWNSDVSGGRPLAANPNAGAFYPLRPLLALVPFPVAFRIFPILHWILSGLGMILLLRTIGVSSGGAWLGAVTYVFSGVGVSEVFYTNHHPGVTLLPWIVWALARRGGSRSGRIVLLSLLLALDFLASDVFTIGTALAACLVWIWLEETAAEERGSTQDLAAAFALAALAALPQVVATLLWAPETNRAVLGMRLREVFLYSISPLRLLELVVPFPFGDTWELDVSRVWETSVFHGRTVGFFSTLYAGALAPIAVIATFRESPAGARFARSFLLGGLLLALPGSLLPESWGLLKSPLPLRYPEKFAVAIVFALAILAGIGFDSLRRRAGNRRWPLAVGGLLAIFAAAAGMSRVFGPSARRLLPGSIAEAGLLWMAAVIGLELLRRRTRASAALAMCLLTIPPIAANRRIARVFREEQLLAPTPFARFVSRADPVGAFRVMGVQTYRPSSALEDAQHGTDPALLEYSRRNWYQYTQVLWKRGTVFNEDFDQGDLSRLESLRRVSRIAAGYRDSPAFFRTLALRWEIRFRDQDPLSGYHRVGGDALMDWDEQERVYPDMRLLESWREEPQALAALSVLPKLAEGEVVVESGSRAAGRARPGRLSVIEKSPERLLLDAAAPDPTWLFVLRGYWNSRTILVDGHPAEDEPAQLAFSAVRVPAGRHRIEWRETLPGGRVTRVGPVLYLFFAVALISAGRRRH